MKELILLKSGEIMMKGNNRSMFEKRLMANARATLEGMGEFKLYKAQGTFYMEPKGEMDLDLAVERLAKVFGFAGIARSAIVEKDFEQIKKVAAAYLRSQLLGAKTFKVRAKRSDKRFPLNSPAICQQLGGFLLEEYPHLEVDVHNPEVEVVVEVRDYDAFVHTQQLPGAGGMPVGSSGKGALLLSGGIDSPVAGYMLAKRGLEIVAVHFESPPYTSARALDKVETLARKMTQWCGPIKLYVVPFTAPQIAMKEHCPDPYITLIMRRMMMRIAEQLGRREGCEALITGESVGQVASQTLAAMTCTDQAVERMPVLRPVVGMDKEEIVEIARKIDTYETAILPYDDCCTVFTPRHPKTRPTLAEMIEAEAPLEMDRLIADCVAGAVCRMIE